MKLISVRDPNFQSANFREEKGRKSVRAVSAESIYQCMLLFLDHILYCRAHFVRDVLRASQAVLAMNHSIKMADNAESDNVSLSFEDHMQYIFCSTNRRKVSHPGETSICQQPFVFCVGGVTTQKLV